MENWHSDKWITDRLNCHFNEALKRFPQDQIFGLFLQGSQNYGLDCENSDVDSKLIVIPSFLEIAFNKKPVNYVIFTENNEQIKCVDIRIFLDNLRKQNINFLEILYTKYKILNPLYADYWEKLQQKREKICRYKEYLVIRVATGIANEAFKNINKGPKNICTIFRMEDFLTKYVSGTEYKKCVIVDNPKLLKSLKLGHYLPTNTIIEKAINKINDLLKNFDKKDNRNTEVENFLNDFQYNIIKEGLK